MVTSHGTARVLALLLGALPLAAQNVYTYVGGVSERSVLIAWGSTAGGRKENTIGRDSTPMGKAVVRIAGRNVAAGRNWAEIGDLEPDTQYDYEVDVNGRRIGGGAVRTWPVRAQRLAFFVIGDYGAGNAGQRAIAQAMQREFDRRASSDNPVRFVLTVGDNIYGDLKLGFATLHSGDSDRDWDEKFYAPYRDLIRRIPFFATLGNHDGNGAENHGDLGVYLDNFFFPGNRPARWYDFSFGGLARFFGLDSTENTESSGAAPAFGPEGEQSKWLQKALPASAEPWKIPFFHHPLFTAGPRHTGAYAALRHWLEAFEKSGVKVVFAGHEHNFQVSESSDATGRIRHFITGSGGELRRGNVQRKMEAARIEGWAPEREFLVVEIEGRTMRVTPMGGNGPIAVRRNSGAGMAMPVVIQLP